MHLVSADISVKVERVYNDQDIYVLTLYDNGENLAAITGTLGSLLRLSDRIEDRLFIATEGKGRTKKTTVRPWLIDQEHNEFADAMKEMSEHKRYEEVHSIPCKIRTNAGDSLTDHTNCACNCHKE